MTSIFMAPRQYIQREGVLLEAETYLREFGRRPLILGDSLVFSIIRPTLESRLSTAGMTPFFTLFGEECSLTEVNRLMNLGQKEKVDFIVGTGGGKALDTSRCLANKMKLPLVTIPTSSATCSAASAAAVIYEKGIRQETVNGKGADLCLVDSGIISRAPAKLLAAGMGDALSKWYEGKPVYDQMKDHDPATQAALNLATQLREAVLKHGRQAYRDVSARKNSFAVETMVETSLLITGIISSIGGSKFRIAVPHALLYGLTVLPQLHHNLHGEVVSWGIVVQLCLEKKEQELEAVLPFFHQTGIPLTLKKLGFSNVEDPLFWEGLKRTCVKDSPAHNLGLPVDEQRLYKAIMEADERAKALEK
jgi:glycerol dehydrogenase